MLAGSASSSPIDGELRQTRGLCPKLCDDSRAHLEPPGSVESNAQVVVYRSRVWSLRQDQADVCHQFVKLSFGLQCIGQADERLKTVRVDVCGPAKLAIAASVRPNAFKVLPRLLCTSA